MKEVFGNKGFGFCTRWAEGWDLWCRQNVSDFLLEYHAYVYVSVTRIMYESFVWVFIQLEVYANVELYMKSQKERCTVRNHNRKLFKAFFLMYIIFHWRKGVLPCTVFVQVRFSQNSSQLSNPGSCWSHLSKTL